MKNKIQNIKIARVVSKFKFYKSSNFWVSSYSKDGSERLELLIDKERHKFTILYYYTSEVYKRGTVPNTEVYKSEQDEDLEIFIQRVHDDIGIGTHEQTYIL